MLSQLASSGICHVSVYVLGQLVAEPFIHYYYKFFY
jgi:hypothetical protein